ncbi:MAG TPA: hypothetical protein DCL86_17585, partial [Bacteroidales bacterium]|nr:hypothetical protein [Bacteroidales bacterium]
YVGYQPTVADDIYLNLGQTYGYNIKLSESASQITGVEIVSSRNELIDGNRTGASTNISTDQITAMPTISRSINDYTRLTPQTGSGNSFAGRDGRYNNITIDGANFNNNFGLSSKNLPGGDAQPISLDAIEEISVNIAPYDIRQSNFTGANINAVTRSGNNTYTGSAYVFYRDKAFNGVNVDDVELTLDKTQTTTYGARFGGPIIKDKLFFFANAEGTTILPGNSDAPDVLELAASYLKTPYLWGGRSPFGIDCSGLTQMVYKMQGIVLMRDARQQAAQGLAINLLAEARAGDLAFFDNEDGQITHTGILTENGNIIHASGKVRIDPVDHHGIYDKTLGKYTHKLRLIRRMQA